MPAINIFKARAGFISGKEKSLHLAKATAKLGVSYGHSFNVDVGHFVNRLWFAYHHRKTEIPGLTAGLDDWLDTASKYTHGDECASRFIYGDWNTQNLKGAYGWCLVTEQPSIAERFRLHLRNYHSILSLATGYEKRPGSKKGADVLPTTVCGNRTFTVDRKEKSKYFDSEGRFLRCYNLDASSLDYHLADETGTARAVGFYGDQVEAFKKLSGRTWRTLTVEEIADLNRADEAALKRIATYLSEGPFFWVGIEILKTTEGVAFVNSKVKGGSTSGMSAMIWTRSKHPNWRNLGHWKVDPHFRWVTTSSPMRKHGKTSVARILKQTDNIWTIEAATEKNNDHYDVASKKFIKGPVFATLEGSLVYHLKWSKDHTSIELPGGVWAPGQGGGPKPPPDNPSESCWDKLKSIIRR